MIPFSRQYNVAERVVVASKRSFLALNDADPATAPEVKIDGTIFDVVPDETVDYGTVEIPHSGLDDIDAVDGHRSILFVPRNPNVYNPSNLNGTR